MMWEKGLKIVGALTLGTLTLRAIRLVVVWSELRLMGPQVRKYRGDWALITGGSEGIGKAVAGALAQQGINVVLVSRTQQKLNAAAKEIKTKCPAVEVRTISVDLSQLTGVQQLLRCLTDSSIPITVFVANLGLNTGSPRPYIEYSATEEAYIQATNGQACYSLVRGLLPGMLLVRCKKMGATPACSTAHRFGTYLAAYGAEKAKLNSLMSSLSQELHGTGITAQSMVIGPVLTRPVAELWAPAPAAAGSTNHNTSTATTEDAATAALARCKPTALTPAADTVGRAIVRAIGRVGPVVIPYWGHAVADWLLLDVLWPPSLQRAACRAMARKQLTCRAAGQALPDIPDEADPDGLMHVVLTWRCHSLQAPEADLGSKSAGLTRCSAPAVDSTSP
eukprot:gene12164-12302_t